MGTEAAEDDNSEAKFRERFEPRIKTVTLDALPAFLSELADYPHDYGTICLALGFAGAAAAWAMEKSPHGGITGFQAGFVGWEFLRQWGSPELGKTGTRILSYDDLLYPQYENKFRNIGNDTWARVMAEARSKLEAAGADGSSVHPAVLAHWQSVADGHVPFGLTIGDA